MTSPQEMVTRVLRGPNEQVWATWESQPDGTILSRHYDMHGEELVCELVHRPGRREWERLPSDVREAAEALTAALDPSQNRQDGGPDA